MDPDLNMVNPDQYGPNAQPAAGALGVAYAALPPEQQAQLYDNVTHNGEGGRLYSRDRLVSAGLGVLVGAVAVYFLGKRKR